MIKIIILFLLFSTFAVAQQDSLSVSYDDSKITVQEIQKEHLEKYKNDTDFNYVEVQQEESILNRFVRWLKNIIVKIFEYIFGVGNATGILKFIFNVLPYLLLAFLIFLLIKFFLNVDSKNVISVSQNSATVNFTEEEHILKNKDIRALIDDAIKNQNYRLAIRYYYLLSLKYLTQSNIIAWQQQKTNEDYISEIKTETLKSDFKNITRIYDYVWYGEFTIDKLKFEILKTPFIDLNKTIETD